MSFGGMRMRWRCERWCLVQALAFPALVLVAFFVFKGAVTGPFVLDDQRIYSFSEELRSRPLGYHLADIGHLAEYVSSRPLAMATFYIEDTGWPTQPYRFKFNNLLLHLINSCLLFLLVYRIFVRTHPPSSFAIAFFAAGIWMLHPIQLSTMMTVVQRMTLLMGTFTLLGMLSYVVGRLSDGNSWPRYFLMTFAVVGMGGLAVLSKPNGVLLIFYLLIVELTLLRGESRPAGFRWWSLAFLVLPAVAIAGSLAARAQAGTDYGIAPRLLTEARVLWDYLGKLLLPRVSELGLYHDDFAVSSSLLSPPSTLPAVIGILLVLTLALWKRRQYPLFSCGALWFLAGQSLESTVIPLELYFEHRNYVPMMGGCIAVAAFLVTRVSFKISRWLIFLVLAILVSVSISYSAVWGNSWVMASTWARDNPQSARAQMHLANQLWNIGRQGQALAVLYQSWERLPTEIYLVVKALEMECDLGRSVTINLQPVIREARDAVWTQALGHSLSMIGSRIREGRCPVVGGADYDRLLAAVLTSRSARNRPQFGFYLWMERVFLAEYMGDLEGAWSAALAAQRLWANPYVSLHLSRIALRRQLQQTALDYWLLAHRQLQQDDRTSDQLLDMLDEQEARMRAAGLMDNGHVTPPVRQGR